MNIDLIKTYLINIFIFHCRKWNGLGVIVNIPIINRWISLDRGSDYVYVPENDWRFGCKSCSSSNQTIDQLSQKTTRWKEWKRFIPNNMWKGTQNINVIIEEPIHCVSHFMYVTKQ